ncbi:dnaJ homolog subfamily C member 15 [Triplophysa rosa]|uniref:dnaJ homolog subfamily C member 15 n=1 Tax=Triplophysa rosa TaxID=992332 RepID=UPI002545D194|nr:dnaJ homolog subfamily C member 15 [Triplophysa rosa]
MASPSSVVIDGDFMRHAEYTPKSNRTTETDIDKRLVSKSSNGDLIGSDRNGAAILCWYAFHLWRPLGQIITEAAKKVPSATFSTYKGGFEQKMPRREASLILGISPNSTKANVGEAHRRIMVLNHPDKGGSPYLAAKINEAKDLLDSGPRR